MSRLVDNDMARPIIERKDRCGLCWGSGKMILDIPEEFHLWLAHKIVREGTTPAETLYIYKQWEKTGKVDCEDCGGTGEITIQE